QDVNGSDVLATLENLTTVAAAEDALRERLAVLAAQLDAEHRGDAFALVCALARGGSRLRVEAGCRDDAHGSAEELTELFAQALSIPPEERATLAARYAAS
ncbi:MAG TPA: hypothetical protein VLM85_22955, partial [Polyangiaceae bacterium]|nr:hypothetical protein [Polyangiaceae bacterium]